MGNRSESSAAGNRQLFELRLARWGPEKPHPEQPPERHIKKVREAFWAVGKTAPVRLPGIEEHALETSAESQYEEKPLGKDHSNPWNQFRESLKNGLP